MTRRHDDATKECARGMFEAGWTPHEIQQYLTRSGTPVAFSTVKAWVDPTYLDERRKRHAEDNRRFRDKAGEHVRARMLELRDRGMSSADISTVVEIYHGRNISPEMVRRFLRHDEERMGVAA